MKKALLPLLTCLAVSSAHAYDVWLGTHCMPQSAATTPYNWSLTAQAMTGLDVNRTPCLPTPGTPNAADITCTNADWTTVLATLTPANANTYIEIPKSQVALAKTPDSVYAGKSTDSGTYKYAINAIMIYNNALGGVNYNWSTADISYLRTWLNNNGHTAVQIWFDGRGTGDEIPLSNPNVVGAVVETSLSRWDANIGNVQQLVAWLYQKTQKHINFQLPASHDYPYSQPYAYQAVRNLVREIGEFMATQGNPKFLSSPRVSLMPCTYNGGTLQDATLQFAPEVTDPATYGNTLTGIALSLYEQKALFQAGATPDQCNSFSRSVAAPSASVTLSNLTQTYDGTAKAATVTTTPGNLPVTITYANGSAPVNAGSYGVTATILDPHYVATPATDTLVIQPAAAAVTLSNLTAVYDGTSKTVGVATAPAALATTVTYNGSATAPTNAGSYTIAATVTDPNYVGSATDTLVIQRAAATVTLSNLEFVYDGTPKAPTVTTAPAALATALTFNGDATAPTTAGAYTVAATVTDPNFSGATTGTLVIDKATPVLTWAQPAAITYGTALGATQLNATASVAGGFLYSPAAGTTLAAGANQPLNVTFTPQDTTDYNPAFASTVLTVNKAPASITLTGLSQAYDGQPKAVTATTSPAGLTVDLTYAGNFTAPVYPGAYAVAATINDANYTGTAQQTLAITTTALARHLGIAGAVNGSVQLVTPEALALTSSTISGDLLVAGTPAVKTNGKPNFGAVIDGPGSAAPGSYTLTLGGSTVLRNVVRHIDPLALPGVPTVAAPTGTRSVTLDAATDAIGDPATLRDLTVNGNAGDVVLPAGTYGQLTLNGGSGFVLGHAGATQPDVYNVQSLVLNGDAHVRIAGPVLLVLGSSLSFSGTIGDAANPEALTVAVATGGVTLNGNAQLNGFVVAPQGSVTLNGTSTLTGEVTADTVTINGSAVLAEP